MSLIDFTYADQKLSNFGYMPCSFDSSDLSSISFGSNATFTTIRLNSSSKNKLLSTKYEDVYTTSEPIQICKKCPSDNIYITHEEFRLLERWLNRGKYLKLTPKYEYENEELYFYGYFNVQALIYGGRIVGAELTFTANSPFAYKYVTQSFDLTNNKLTFSLNSISDDFKPIYPNINITLKQASDLSLMNMIDNSVTSIKNCSENETISINGENKIIISSLSHTSLPNDFNYEFPKIYTSYEIATNNFSVSAPCTVTISYELPRKVGVY
jgi:hypothetical protein